MVGFDPGLSGAFAISCPRGAARDPGTRPPRHLARDQRRSARRLSADKEPRACTAALARTDTFARKKDHGRAEAALLAAETIAA